ncbi:MAG: hypothetical protein IPO64_09495 [Bacteroidetes bacterium]|nr:hypothetical protein [Bacteroidota bacterium]
MSFYVELQVPVSAVLGTEIEYEAWVNGTQGDTTPIDNYAKWTETVRGSFDHDSGEKPPSRFDVKRPIVYQRTAFYVRVKDEMPANLNLSTLRVINASHAYQLIVREKNIVEFAFPNILLPTKPPTNQSHMALYNFLFSQKRVCL